LEPELVKRYDHLAVELDEFRTDLFEAILEEALERMDRNELEIKELMQEFHGDKR
jgi:predicted transcriptional regulator